VLPNRAITHFAGPVQVPGGPTLLRVTAPRLRPEEALDRLVLTAIHLPRRHRVAGLARRRTAGRAPSTAKLRFLGDTDMPPADKVIIDLGDLGTAFDAAKSLVFHHPELLTLMNDPADTILNLIEYADGLLALAQSMLDQSQANQQDPTQPNWVNSQAGTDWRTGQPSAPIYVWSAQTVENLALPLQSALRHSKNAPDLQGLQPGITQVPLTDAAQGARLGTAEAHYIVKELTPQSGVENSFSFDPSSKTATINLKNWYLRWLMVSLDQYGPNGAKIGGTATLGEVSPVDTIMAIPLPAQWSSFSFPLDEHASSATVSMGGLGQVPFDWTYDGDGIILTAVFNFAVPTMFIALGVAVDQGGSKWTELTKSIVGKLLTVLEAAAEGPIGGAVSGGVSLEDVPSTTVPGPCCWMPSPAVTRSQPTSPRPSASPRPRTQSRSSAGSRAPSAASPTWPA